MTTKKLYSKAVLWSAYLGNLFEHYDAALFGFLSPFLAPLIFPEKEPLSALILTYAMIPLGMLARPIGSLFFGHIGDHYGRGKALFLSLAGMGLVSIGIAFSPTFLQAGFLAPLIFCIGRVLQNFFSSGETMGGAIFLLENTPEKKHDLLSSFYNASTIGGILLASALISLLSYHQKVDTLWRLTYFIGGITALFGCMIRKKIPNEPSYVEKKPFFQSFLDLRRVFWLYKKPLFFIMVISGFSYSTYSISMILMNGFVPLISSITKAQMMSINTYLLLLDFCALPFFGWLSSKVSREKLMLASAFSVVVGAVPLFLLLNGASLLTIVSIRTCFVLLGVAFAAPFHAWAQQLIPEAHRYIVISFGYALGSQLLGGPTAAISLWIYKKTNLIVSVSWYWLFLGSISSFILVALQKKRVADQSFH
jgi:MFS transporter, MHS family, proline/betaine transporter